MARKKAGRKSKLTPAMVQRAYEMAAQFATNKQICETLGISVDTFYTWKNKAEEGGLYAEFSEALKKGHEEYLDDMEREALANIRKADSWQSDAWILERVFPERYGRVDRLHAEVKQETQAKVEVEHYFDYGDEEENGEEVAE